MKRRLFAGALGALALVRPSIVLAQSAAQVPEHNRADLTEAPPRPPLGDASERAQRLLEAILRDEPTHAEDFFLPQAAFALIKGISDPDSLWTRIHHAYEEDIHELHATVASDARFGSLQFTGRRGWVRVREESNRLPYWAQRHSWLNFESAAGPGRFEVRTMIAWDDRWYITHLSEFR